MGRTQNIRHSRIIVRNPGMSRDYSRYSPPTINDTQTSNQRAAPRLRSGTTSSGQQSSGLPGEIVNLADLPDGAPIRSGVIITEPMGYMDFLNIWKDAAVVVTDSGGLQEETTALKVPCITIRENTERPVTAEVGSNEIVGRDEQKIKTLFYRALEGKWKDCRIPDLWDGKAAERIAALLAR